MKRTLLLAIATFLTAITFAQNTSPTVNWPYLYPDFVEGEMLLIGGKYENYKFNIHLNLGALHYVHDGVIKEHPIIGVESLKIGDDLFQYVGGKMLKVMAKTDGGMVVHETLANYSSIISKDGAYGSSLANTEKRFSHEKNVGSYNGYLITDNYADLLALKNQSDKLPVVKRLYLSIGYQLIPANKNSVSNLNGLDRKAFKSFLKAEKIKWNNPQDLVKVIDFITAD